MRYWILCTIIILSACGSSNRYMDSHPMDKINGTDNRDRRIQLAEVYYNKLSQKGLPYISGDTCTFLFKGRARSVHIAGDMNGWNNKSHPMKKIDGTDIWYYNILYPPKTRLEYKFVIDDQQWILDPVNPKSTTGQEFVNSVLQYPNFPQPLWEIPIKDVPHGSLHKFGLESEIMDTVYSYSLYVPAGYEVQGMDSFGLAIFHDGQNNIDIARSPTILDNMIYSREMIPIFAIFLNHNQREQEYAGEARNKFAAMIVKELLPSIQNNYRIYKDPGFVASIGQSFGGNISAIISFSYHEKVGLCGSHSGAYWPKNKATVRLMLNNKNAPIKYAAIWGSFESLDGYNQEIADQLTEAGRSVYAKSYPEGHNWTLWTHTYHEMLRFLFPFKKQ